LSIFPLPIITLILTLVLVPWIVFVGVPIVEIVQKRLKLNEKNH
jgi:antibiotic biosynthesis monooxygenase (ABM) superfamily enzyme